MYEPEAIKRKNKETDRHASCAACQLLNKDRGTLESLYYKEISLLRITFIN